jgi:hypothetical protein
LMVIWGGGGNVIKQVDETGSVLCLTHSFQW